MAYTAFDRFIAWCRFRAALPHVSPESRVCDVGCGLDAAFLKYSQPRIRFGVGVDYQPMTRPNGGQRLVRCDIMQGLPIRDAEFDHAVMLAVLEHLENPQSLLEELFRILVPGGSLIMTWPQAAVDPLLNVLHGIGFVSQEMESDKHQSRLPLARVTTMLKEIGFNNFKHKRFEFGLNNLLVCWKPS